jgi:hypothetical protein
VVDDEVRAEVALGLQALLDAVDRGELTADSLEELELMCRIEGAVATLEASTDSSSRADGLPGWTRRARDT